MTPWLHAPGDATRMEEWLRAGLIRRLEAGDEAERSGAFAGIDLGPGDPVIALDAAVPAAERMTLALAVRNALATGEAGCGGPEALALLLALARRLRPPGCMAPLASLWRRRGRAGTPDGQMLEMEVFHTACVLAAGGLPEALRFIDSVRDDPERWHAGFCDLWLRAKLRSSTEHMRPPRWTQLLEELKEEFQTRIKQGFRMTRFLDEVLSDAGPLPKIRRDIEAYAGPDGLPWFFNHLFGRGGPLRVEWRDGRRVLVRLVAADTRHERRKAEEPLGGEPQTDAGRALIFLWDTVVTYLCDAPQHDMQVNATPPLAPGGIETDDLVRFALLGTSALIGTKRMGGGMP